MDIHPLKDAIIWYPSYPAREGKHGLQRGWMSVRLCPSMSGRRFSYVQTKSEKLAISRSRCDVKGKELNKTAFAKTDAESYEKREGNGKKKGIRNMILYPTTHCRIPYSQYGSIWRLNRWQKGIDSKRHRSIPQEMTANQQ